MDRMDQNGELRARDADETRADATPVDRVPAEEVDRTPIEPVDRTPVEPAPVDAAPAAVPIGSGNTVRQDVVAREKAEFGGFKFGAAFFGWLTATGTGIILTAIVAGAGAAVGLDAGDAADAADSGNAAAIGIGGAIAVLVALFIAYLAGGYVAGRMSRFSGAKQGLAVWLWAVIIAIVLAIVAAVAGAQFNVLANLNSFPRIPIDEGQLSAAGILAIVGTAIVSLVGAVLGGLAGMRYHRRIDRVGLGR